MVLSLSFKKRPFSFELCQATDSRVFLGCGIALIDKSLILPKKLCVDNDPGCIKDVYVAKKS